MTLTNSGADAWAPEERERLAALGWTGDFKSYALRQTEVGWQLAFVGDADDLFALLRSLKGGLVEGSRQGATMTPRR